MMKKIIYLFAFLFIAITNAQIDDKLGFNNFLQAGTISVTIGGEFITTGTFPALVTERVDQFVTRIYNEAAEKILATATSPYVLEEFKKRIEKFSLREIILKRSTGEILTLDLQKFRINGDFVNNPYMKNDDVIIFPSYDIERNFFTIEGAVNSPGRFYYSESDDLQDALELSRGINKAYENVQDVDIYRLSYDGNEMNVIRVTVSSTISLQRGDRIVVVADETQKKEFSVLVFGEVNRPGIVPVSKNNTTLKTVLENAGGFTEEASLKRSKLLRGSNNIRFIIESEFGLNLEDVNDYFRGWPNPLLFQYEANTMLRMSTLTEEDTTFFLIDEQIRQMINDATIDFTQALDENSETSKIKIRDGDVIIIPPKLHSVYVYGQVGNPGIVSYSEGKDFRYYIKEAGGLGALALDEDEIMIIKGDSKEWISAEDFPNNIDPGDFIYIPKDPIRSFDYHITKLTNYLSIIGSIATVIILVVQLGK